MTWACGPGGGMELPVPGGWERLPAALWAGVGCQGGGQAQAGQGRGDGTPQTPSHPGGASFERRRQARLQEGLLWCGGVRWTCSGEGSPSTAVGGPRGAGALPSLPPREAFQVATR